MSKTHTIKRSDSCGAANCCTVAAGQAAVTRPANVVTPRLQKRACSRRAGSLQVHVKRLRRVPNTDIDTFYCRLNGELDKYIYLFT